MTATSPLYPVPSEARARRRGGRGFYRDRGLPYTTPYDSKHAERDQKRSPEEREAAELGRALAELAERYPRFKTS